MRMVKQTFAGTCKMCEKPYTLFRWNPRQGARQKRTEICQTCSRIKNICQCCLLDLQYGTKTVDSHHSHGCMHLTSECNLCTHCGCRSPCPIERCGPFVERSCACGTRKR